MIDLTKISTMEHVEALAKEHWPDAGWMVEKFKFFCDEFFQQIPRGCKRILVAPDIASILMICDLLTNHTSGVDSTLVGAFHGIGVSIDVTGGGIRFI